MPDKLTITGFGGIKHVEIEIGRMTVLIGPQAAGKSLCARWAYWCRDWVTHLAAGVRTRETLRAPAEAILDGAIRQLFPTRSWGPGAFEIESLSGSSRIRVRRAACTDNLEIEADDAIPAALEELRSMMVGNPAPRDLAPHGALERAGVRLGEAMGLQGFSPHVFVPAGRAQLAMLQHNYFLMDQLAPGIDPIILRFARFYRDALDSCLEGQAFQHYFGTPDEDASDALRERVQALLGAQLDRVNGETVVLRHADGRVVEMRYASSAQQESAPLLMALWYLARWQSDRVRWAYVEEPETHLFPASQHAVVRLMAELMHRSPGLGFFVTTHSPYILTSVNNLLEAGRIASGGDDRRKARVHEIMGMPFTLDPSGFRAYMLADGEARNLIEAESGLMIADAIDGVSEVIGAQFDELLDIAYGQMAQ